MNPESQNTPPESAPARAKPEATNAPPAASSGYRAKGKIASLPKEQRDLIHHLLQDGSTYPAVCQKMSELGLSLNLDSQASDP